MGNENLIGNVIDFHMDDIRKTIKKNKRRIFGLKVTVGFLILYSLGLALELAERKRSENYLQEEIEKLKEEVHGVENDESDGGACDA